MSIPLLIITFSAIISIYVYNTQIYSLKLSTPITFISVIFLWFLGLILIKKNKSENQSQETY